MGELRRCTKCGDAKPLTGFTIRLSGRLAGKPVSYCKACCASNARAYRLAHPEKIRERNAAFTKANPGWHKKYDDARYAADPVGQRARSAAWKAAHPEQDAERKRAWYAANAVGQRARVKAWRATNREQMRHQLLRRRARRFGNGGSHTLAEWKQVCDLWAHCCAYCGEAKKLTRDHKVPLSRGGTDDITNIVPACRSCNSKKQALTAVEYLARTA